MTTSEIIKFDLEELLKQTKIKEDIDLQIKIKNIKRNIDNGNINYNDIKELYMETNNFYIFEIKDLNKIFTLKEKLLKLEYCIDEEDYSNIFILLDLIGKNNIEKKIIEKLLIVLEKNKEYIYILNDFLEEETNVRRNKNKIILKK